MPNLTREEVERRLARSFPADHSNEVVALMGGFEREALQTAQALYAKLDELAAERDDWRDAAKVNRDEARKLEAVAEAAWEYRSSQRVLMLNEIKADEPKYERQRKAKVALDNALAAWREGEAPDAHL